MQSRPALTTYFLDIELLFLAGTHARPFLDLGVHMYFCTSQLPLVLLFVPRYDLSTSTSPGNAMLPIFNQSTSVHPLGTDPAPNLTFLSGPDAD